jgi:hypothetical protein
MRLGQKNTFTTDNGRKLQLVSKNIKVKNGIDVIRQFYIRITVRIRAYWTTKPLKKTFQPGHACVGLPK